MRLENVESFEMDFLPSFCDTRTLEIFQILQNCVETALHDSTTNKKYYLSSNKKGIVTFPKTNTSKSFFIRFDLTPYVIKIHLLNPSNASQKIIRKFFPEASLERGTGKGSKNNLEFFLNTLTTSDEIITVLLEVISKTLNENAFKISNNT